MFEVVTRRDIWRSIANMTKRAWTRLLTSPCEANGRIKMNAMPAKRVARQPREWALEPTKFGEVPDTRSTPMRWHRAVDEYEQISLDAAKIQHEVIVMANVHRLQRGASWKDLAVEFQMSYDQLAKVVRGQAHISIRHVADIERVLGQVLITEYRRLVQQVDPDT